MIAKLFGENCKRAKVFDLILSHPYSEYTKTDINEITGIARGTLNTFIDDLIEYEIIKPTKPIGNGQLYQLNMDSTITQALNSFQNQLADIEFEKEMKESGIETESIRPFEEIVKKEMEKNSHDNEKANESIKIIEGPLESKILNYYLGESVSQTEIISTENSISKSIATVYM